MRHGAAARRTMAKRAAGHGIYLNLEPLNRFETYFLNTMAQACAYCDLVDHPACRIM
ncbi:MAG: sugar phosphate isomerase/epimerase [Candidatus Devosia symbiotica]|nr:sugar phosphate isomerase/epimerase [Candidatus Devosia symbiotica]